MYITADPPHLLKNIKQALISNHIITIPDNIVCKYNLLSNKIELRHFNELMSIQENCELLLTPKLQRDDINSTNTFNKMKVGKATNFFSNDVSSSLQLLATCKNIPEYRSAAWFVTIVRK